ncbi:hypothetical protein [Rhizobium sp. Root1220]|uniref:hypothetical protein n=1 Tax=Rhizobium sp. Root1220 TaxID=1736432 RepID=UPI0006F838C8|nr:hypothetical protein [Rhizobium sp. Root1220]KQV84107.1 hypothetical protein ASC90_00865 [Rhizobium sp. Root1220]
MSSLPQASGCEGSMETVLAAKSALDTGGHSSRPDLLRLFVEQVLRRGLRSTAEELATDDQPRGEAAIF